MPAEIVVYLQSLPILRTCSCVEFHHYARCVHSVLYSISKLGRQIVPRGEDIRLAGPRAGRGRPLNSPDAYGVPHAESQRRRRKRREEPTSPNPTRRQLRLADAGSPSASTRSRSALTRHVAFPALS
jgi:hypothetical protein